MTPLFKKLNLTALPSITVLQAPDSFGPELDGIRAFTQVQTSLPKATSFLLAFVTRQEDVNRLAPQADDALQGDGVLWFAYPKKSSKKYTCDFNRDTGWEALGRLGFEPVRMIAIDEDWSALRFRRVAYIKTMTRSKALSEDGRKKMGKKE